MIKIKKISIIPKFFSFFLLFTIFYLLFTSTPIFAANISLNLEKQSYGLDEEFLVNIFLDTEGQAVNAVEGSLVYPIDILNVKEIRDGDSSITFWMEKPKDSKPGIVSFSGIVPGGISAKKVFLYSIVFQTKKVDKGVFKMESLKVLQNDGKGTSAQVNSTPISFTVSKEAVSSAQVKVIVDNDIPEDFRPAVESNSTIFDGKYFLVFITQDKGSGIASYKVREGMWGWYSAAESPYLLKNQSLNKKIFVKAIDKYGNERVVTLAAKNPLPWYKQFEIFVIILLIIITTIFLRRKWLRFLQN